MSGALVWAHAGTPVQVQTLAALHERMEEDGDAPRIIITGSDGIRTYAQDAGFGTFAGTSMPRLQGQKPDLVLWMTPDLSASALREAITEQLCCVLVDAGAGGVLPRGGWIRGRTRSRLQSFDYIITINAVHSERLARLGVPDVRLHALGHFRDIPLPEASGGKQAQSLSAQITPRPIWMAQNLPQAELRLVLDAHHQASRHAPRLLLVIETDDPALCDLAVAQAQDQHLAVLGHDHTDLPEDLHQVLVREPGQDTASWQRLASATYIGGSLSAGAQADPLVPAQVGSVVIHGPAYGGYAAALRLLSDAAASSPIANADELAGRVAQLMVPDQAAELAAAAWQVISEGANTCNFIVDVIRGEA